MQDQRLAELLGQNAVEERILADLEEEKCRLVRLTGGEGSGKSYIARRVAEVWREKGGDCVFAVGDDKQHWKELFPLLSGLARTPRDWTGLATEGSRSAIQVGEKVAGSPGIGTSIFDLLTASFRQQTERALRPYSNLAKDVILDLKRLARRHRLLLVADNAHWWDADSLRLLTDVISGPLPETISQLQSIVVLMVDTSSEQSIVAPDSFETLIAKCGARTHWISRCTRMQFPAVLKMCGVSKPLPEGIINELFSATNGHLLLAEQIGRYKNPGEIAGSLSRGLVAARLASLGLFSPEVIDLLVRAAVLGLSCSEPDLECIVDRRRTELRALVAKAEGIGFIEQAEEQILFRHEVIRATILREQSASHLEDLYLKLSECIAILRPGDYEARAEALLRAGELRVAREMTALAAVAQIRRGVSIATVLHRAELRFPRDRQLTEYLEVIADGYSAVASGNFDVALPALRLQLESESTAMAAERNYLAAICLLGLQTAEARSDARAILSSWSAALTDEVELTLRFSVLLQQAQVLSEMFDEACETEMLIEQGLSKRAPYDPDARVMIHIQHRRSAGLLTPDFAEERIERAVTFFRNGTGEPSRDQLEMFRSLTNQAAIKIRLNKNDEAYTHALEAESIAIESLDVGHRLDVLASNLVLAGYRCGSIDLTGAIERQNLVVNSPEGSGDNFIQRCNLIAYLLLASKDEMAMSELEMLQLQLQDIGVDESYLVYYSGALSVAAAAVRGQIEEALRRHREMERFVDSLKWPTASYIRRRQRLLEEALPTLRADRPRKDLDRILIESMPMQVGRAWSYYGRLIPCCELSFWADS